MLSVGQIFIAFAGPPAMLLPPVLSKKLFIIFPFDEIYRF